MTDTPMVAQYKKIKSQHQDKILFFRLGDFYEMFFEDAQVASRELEITLTSREAGKGNRMPMCGVPYHSADGYIARLLEKGFKVAICEQVGDPEGAERLVRREVVRVITPGTFLDPQVQEAKKNNYLVAVDVRDDALGLAVADSGTGEFRVTGLSLSEGWDLLKGELVRLQPAECLYPRGNQELLRLLEELDPFCSFLATPRPQTGFDPGACCGLLKAEDQLPPNQGEQQAGLAAAGALLQYFEETQRVKPVHVTGIEIYQIKDFMVIDGATRRNLELTESMRTENKKTSLLGVLDFTRTAMGGRTLRKWLEQPLVTERRIRERLDAVETLIEHGVLRATLGERLKGVYDLERLMGKVVYQTANGRDLLSLRKSLEELPRIKEALKGIENPLLQRLDEELDPSTDIRQLLDRALVDDPPPGLKEGNLIKEGFDQEVDRLRGLSQRGREWLAELEAKERDRTGIRNIKVGYNKVFGYYLEVTKSNLHAVPSDYIRKQTLVNAERYITPQLKEWEAEITGAQERCVELEYNLFIQLREQVAGQVDRIQRAARIIGRLDSLRSLALAAIENRYVKPEINMGDVIQIEGGRHPVVETIQPDNPFVPNDTLLDNRENQLLLITGPNMAGKSTYIRQVALIVLLAQVGSFVPARKACIGVVDRIFTRIGAADDLAAGESTFMVEMKEVANILGHATPKSLIILDEIGRGTSTFDGLSIARAVAEYILENEHLQAKTLFATHYHELTQLATEYTRVKNYTSAVEEEGDDIVFLRKIVPGTSDRSYGIHVARLAQLPKEVVERADALLLELEKGQRETLKEAAAAADQEGDMVQLDLFTAVEKQALVELARLDPLRLSPLEALQEIFRLQGLLQGEGGKVDGFHQNSR